MPDPNQKHGLLPQVVETSKGDSKKLFSTPAAMLPADAIALQAQSLLLPQKSQLGVRGERELVLNLTNGKQPGREMREQCEHAYMGVTWSRRHQGWEARVWAP